MKHSYLLFLYVQVFITQMTHWGLSLANLFFYSINPQFLRPFFYWYIYNAKQNIGLQPEIFVRFEQIQWFSRNLRAKTIAAVTISKLMIITNSN